MLRFALVSTLVATGCASAMSQRARCRVDADCPGAAVCDATGCVDPAELGTPALLASERLMLSAEDDAVVAQGLSSRALGATDFLLVGSGAGSTWRTYIRFDLAALNQARTITRAELRFRARSDPPGLPRRSTVVGVYLARAPWRGARLTWENQPGPSGAERAFAVVPGAAETEVRIDVSELVSDLVRGVSPNHGFVLRSRSEGADARVVAFSSRSPVAGARPWLEVLHR